MTYLWGLDLWSGACSVLFEILLSFCGRPAVCSVLYIWIITLNRLIFIIYPLHYAQKWGCRLVNWLILAAWLLAIASSAFFVVWIYILRESLASCSEEPVRFQLYSKDQQTATCSLGDVFLLVANASILYVARKHRHRINEPSLPVATPKMMTAVIVVYLMAWTVPPLVELIRTALQLITGPYTVMTFTAIMWLGYANSAVNIFIYAWKNHNFRQAFSNMLRS